MRSRVELFEKIRRDRRLDDLSIRELADRHGVHRRTVRQALAAAVPPPRRVYPVRPRPAIDPWVTVIDAWLIADKDAPRKQRHTARRVWQRLVAEHQATLSEVTVSRYVARRRVELGLLTREVSIPQTHLAGRRGRGRLRRVLLHDRRGGREVLDVRDATIPLGQSVSHRVRHPGPGSLPGGSCVGLPVLRGRTRPDPV